MRLLVSIHDVTPAHADAVARLWVLCAERGLRPALLVVPDWHGRWPVERHPDFVGWIRDRVADGAELVLHGERHDEAGSPRALRDRWRAWGRTAREGEFLTLDGAAARERVGRGLARLRALGLEPWGFVPPAWLAREAAHRAAAEAGLRFSEDARSIRLLPSGRRLPSPVLRWSARTPARAWGSVAVAHGRRFLQRRAPVARIALHPGDLGHPAVRASLAPALDSWLADRAPARYADLAAGDVTA